MPWNLRLWRRKKIGPGLSINLSKSGPSLSIGPRGSKVTVGPRGIRQTVGVPGTGLFGSKQTSWRTLNAAGRPEVRQSESAWAPVVGGDEWLPIPAAPPATLEPALPESTTRAVPRTTAQAEALLATRPSGWEYLYFATLLMWGRDGLEPKFAALESGPALPTGERLDDRLAAPHLSDAINALQQLVASLDHLFAPDRLERAFGPPGKPGDPGAIGQLAAHWTAVYEAVLNWIARIRGATVPDLYRGIYNAAAHLADEPAREYHAYVDTFVATMDQLPEQIA
ncbi:MAG: DUF4236 domain-containing protein, partial [Gemmatimonadales bacterium]